MRYHVLNFIEIRSVVSKAKQLDRRTDSLPYVSSFCALRAKHAQPGPQLPVFYLNSVWKSAGWL
jgi:hypothetical protein